MTYCPTCGVDHHADEIAAEAAVDREVEIARINAKRDVDVARISARLERDALDTAEQIAETEGEAEVGAAAAEAAVLGEMLNADAAEQEPLVIDAPPTPEPEPDPTDDAAPPPIDEHQAAPDEDKPRKRGLGMWA